MSHRIFCFYRLPNINDWTIKIKIKINNNSQQNKIKESFGERKSNLFFRLHELQTCSWGVSKIGRVAQTIRPKQDNPNQFYLYSEFDTSIFSLTVIPILGWFKVRQEAPWATMEE